MHEEQNIKVKNHLNDKIANFLLSNWQWVLLALLAIPVLVYVFFFWVVRDYPVSDKPNDWVEFSSFYANFVGTFVAFLNLAVFVILTSRIHSFDKNYSTRTIELQKEIVVINMKHKIHQELNRLSRMLQSSVLLDIDELDVKYISEKRISCNATLVEYLSVFGEGDMQLSLDTDIMFNEILELLSRRTSSTSIGIHDSYAALIERIVQVLDEIVLSLGQDLNPKT